MNTVSLSEYIAEESAAAAHWRSVHPYDIEAGTRLRSKRHPSLVYLVDSVAGFLVSDLVKLHKLHHPDERRQLTRAECYKFLETIR